MKFDKKCKTTEDQDDHTLALSFNCSMFFRYYLLSYKYIFSIEIVFEFFASNIKYEWDIKWIKNTRFINAMLRWQIPVTNSTYFSDELILTIFFLNAEKSLACFNQLLEIFVCLKQDEIHCPSQSWSMVIAEKIFSVRLYNFVSSEILRVWCVYHQSYLFLILINWLIFELIYCDQLVIKYLIEFIGYNIYNAEFRLPCLYKSNKDEKSKLAKINFIDLWNIIGSWWKSETKQWYINGKQRFNNKKGFVFHNTF